MVDTLIAFDSVSYFDKNIDISDFNAEKKGACISLMKFIPPHIYIFLEESNNFFF